MLSSPTLIEYEEDGEEDAEEQNEVDFEVVEMSDTMRPSVIQMSEIFYWCQ